MDEKGKFCLILPALEAEKFRALAEKKGLYLSKLLRVKSRTDKDTDKRHLMQFEVKPTEFSEKTLDETEKEEEGKNDVSTEDEEKVKYSLDEVIEYKLVEEFKLM